MVALNLSSKGLEGPCLAVHGEHDLVHGSTFRACFFIHYALIVVLGILNVELMVMGLNHISLFTVLRHDMHIHHRYVIHIIIMVYIYILYLFYMNHWWIDQSRWDGFSFLASNPGGVGRWNPRRLSRRWTSCRSRSKLKSSAWRKVGIVRMGKLMRSCKITARPGSLVRKNKSTHQPLVPVEIFCNQVIKTKLSGLY